MRNFVYNFQLSINSSKKTQNILKIKSCKENANLNNWKTYGKLTTIKTTHKELCFKFSKLFGYSKIFYRHFKKNFSKKSKISVIPLTLIFGENINYVGLNSLNKITSDFNIKNILSGRYSDTNKRGNYIKDIIRSWIFSHLLGYLYDTSTCKSGVSIIEPITVALYIALYKGLYITGTIVSMTAIIADTWPRNYYKIEIVLIQYYKQTLFMYLPSANANANPASTLLTQEITPMRASSLDDNYCKHQHNNFCPSSSWASFECCVKSFFDMFQIEKIHNKIHTRFGRLSGLF
ncbi:hypothetical protein AGLY_009970 [Aphis glycines]|uniref:Uncharacterized protein n=1 Tax=Aphis glycines TaxID=307491 RepID=A0A6G0TG32_APHGL|nr:hypothetical protein AGLY_009970 [Aphis glycines]